MYFWLVYGVRQLPFAETDDPVYKKVRTALIAMPVLAVLAFVAGQTRASGAIAAVGEPYKVKMKGGEERQRVLLRSFDKGLLVRSPTEERVEFIKWDQIEEVTKRSPKDRGESLSCLWLNLHCLKEQFAP